MRASLLLGVVCGGLLLCGFVATPAVAQEVAGPGVPIEATGSGEPIDEAVEVWNEETGSVAPNGGTLVFGEDGETYLVLSFGERRAGYVTVEEGYTIEHPAVDATLVIAREMTVETDATPADLQQLRGSPTDYTDDVYRVKGHYQQVSTRFNPTDEGFDISRYEAVGGFGDQANLSNDVVNAGAWAVTNTSWSRNATGVERPGTDRKIVAYNPRESYWIDAPTAVKGMVVDMRSRSPDIGLGGIFETDAPYLFIVTETEPQAERTAAPGEITSGNISSGTRVTVESTGAYLTLSVRDRLVDAAPCGPNIVVFPPTGCLPLYYDTTVTGGAVGTGPGNAAFFIALGNTDSSSFIERTGRFKITGEVITPESAGVDVPAGGVLRADAIQRVEEVSITSGMSNLSEAPILEASSRLGETNLTQTPVIRQGGEPVAGVQASAQLSLISLQFVNQWGGIGDEVVVEATLTNSESIAGAGELTFAAAGEPFHNESVELEPGETATVTASYEITGQTQRAITVAGTRIGMAGYNESALATETPDSEVEIANSPGESTSDGSFPITGMGAGFVLSYWLLRRRWCFLSS